VSAAEHKASEVFALDCLSFAVLASLTCPAIVMNTPRLHYSQVFCKYGAPAIHRTRVAGDRTQALVDCLQLVIGHVLITCIAAAIICKHFPSYIFSLPTNAAKPMAEPREWTARHSRTSKRTAGTVVGELTQELKSRPWAYRVAATASLIK
jgi:hypothetical protein